MFLMSNNGAMFGIIGLLSGILLTIVYFGLGNNRMNGVGVGMMGQQARQDAGLGVGNSTIGMDEIMSRMMTNLNARSGDDFDRAFLAEMIDHHEGALEMAKQAQKRAKHQEILDLSREIIDAQTSEIEMMKGWQKTWGY